MNETLLNMTQNGTGGLPSAATNETLGQAANQAGGFALDKLLNMTWADGLAGWLNTTLNTQFFTGALITALLPVLTITFLYFKWDAIMNFISSTGKILLVLLAFYLVLKALGVF